MVRGWSHSRLASPVRGGGGRVQGRPVLRAARTVHGAGATVTIIYTSPWLRARVAVSGAFALAGRTRGLSPKSGGQPIRLSAGDATLAAGPLAISAVIPGGAPPALVARYGRGISSTEARIAGYPVRAYTWSRAGEWLAAYVLPGLAGDSAIICHAPTAAVALSQACTLMAQRAAVTDAAAILPPGPDVQLASEITGALTPVHASRSGLDGLNEPTLSGRTSGATAVANAESRAEGRLERLTATSPPRYHSALAQLTAALRQEQRAFQALASAARSGDGTGYTPARLQAERASRRLGSAAHRVGQFVLALPKLGALTVASPPVSETVSPVSSSNTVPSHTRANTTSAPQQPPAGHGFSTSAK